MIKQVLREFKKTDELKTKFLDNLINPKVAGNISRACKNAGISREIVYKWKKADSAFNSKLNNAVSLGKETLAEIAEDALVKKLRLGDTTAIIFTLKSLRREYYGETSYFERKQAEKSQGIKVTEENADSWTKLMWMYYKYNLPNFANLSDGEKQTFEAIAEKLIKVDLVGSKTEKASQS